MTPAEQEIDTLQAALEAEEHQIKTELWRVQEALRHLQKCRHDLRKKEQAA